MEPTALLPTAQPALPGLGPAPRAETGAPDAAFRERLATLLAPAPVPAAAAGAVRGTPCAVPGGACAVPDTSGSPVAPERLPALPGATLQAEVAQGPRGGEAQAAQVPSAAPVTAERTGWHRAEFPSKVIGEAPESALLQSGIVPTTQQQAQAAEAAPRGSADAVQPPFFAPVAVDRTEQPCAESPHEAVSAAPEPSPPGNVTTPDTWQRTDAAKDARRSGADAVQPPSSQVTGHRTERHNAKPLHQAACEPIQGAPTQSVPVLTAVQQVQPGPAPLQASPSAPRLVAAQPVEQGSSVQVVLSSGIAPPLHPVAGDSTLSASAAVGSVSVPAGASPTSTPARDSALPMPADASPGGAPASESTFFLAGTAPAGKVTSSDFKAATAPNLPGQPQPSTPVDDQGIPLPPTLVSSAWQATPGLVENLPPAFSSTLSPATEPAKIPPGPALAASPRRPPTQHSPAAAGHASPTAVAASLTPQPASSAPATAAPATTPTTAHPQQHAGDPLLPTRDAAAATLAVPNATPSAAAPAHTAEPMHDAQPVSHQHPAEPFAPAVDSLPTRTLAAQHNLLEVGVATGTHGWLRVRAELGANGAVSAAMVAGTPEAAAGLRRELPALSAFLGTAAQPAAALSVQVRNDEQGANLLQGGGAQGREANPQRPLPAAPSVSQRTMEAEQPTPVSSQFAVREGGWLSVRV